MIIESACENFLEASLAQKNKATRIELCENLALGGVTPSMGSIKKCVEALNIPIFVMIRPRGGNFVYSLDELEIMIEDIKVCQNLKASGVVFGCLKEDNTLDYEKMQKLLSYCQGIETTIHRCFDEIQKPWLEVEKLAQIGFKHILSAGGKSTIFDGKETLAKTYQKCLKHNIKLTAAGKITKDTLNKAIEEVPANAYHGRSVVDLF